MSMKVKYFSTHDHFCQHAAQHFVFFFRVGCIGTRSIVLNLKNYCKKKGFPILL